MISEFGIILLFIIGAILFLSIALGISWFLRPNRPNPEKLTPYECGEEPISNAWGNFNSRFYIIALIFILFDVELAFIFPCAIVFGNAAYIQATEGMWGWLALGEICLFIAILALGLAYVWAKGHLEWLKPKIQQNDFKGKVPTHLYEKLNEQYASKKPKNN